MKNGYVELARKNGRLARVKAGRVAVMLRLYQENPANRQWLRERATLLSKHVAYHLRQASILGNYIKTIE